MKVWKRLASVLLALCMVFTLLPVFETPAAAAPVGIYIGNVKLPLDKYPVAGVNQTAISWFPDSGYNEWYQCAGFAKEVFETVFKVSTTTGVNVCQKVYPGNVTVDALKAQILYNGNVKPGAIIRTSCEEEMYFNGNYQVGERGHSMILVSATENDITVYDGNGDGANGVRWTCYSWYDFCNIWFIWKKYGLQSVLMPQSYPPDPCDHSCGFTDIGTCKNCGYSYPYNDTFCDTNTESTKRSGIFTILNGNVYAHTMPYENSKQISPKLKLGGSVEVLGTVTNKFSNTWYKINDNCYIYSDYLKYSSPLPSKITFTGLSQPASPHQRGATWVLSGNIHSSKSLASVSTYIENVETHGVYCSATDVVSGRDYALANSPIDSSLYFNYLEPGQYVYYIKATDTSGYNQVWTSEQFSVGEPLGSYIKRPEIASQTIVDNGVSVALRTNTDYTNIYYTTDGSTPSITNGTLYNLQPVLLKSTCTLKAVSVDAQGTVSPVMVQTITVPRPNIPAMSSQETSNGVMVSIAAENAQIYYSIDNNNFIKYQSPVIVTSVGETTVYAYAERSGVRSDTNQLTVKATLPKAPEISLCGETGGDVAQGHEASVKWNAVSNAASYTLTLYKGDEAVDTVTTDKTICNLFLPDIAEYSIKVKAHNAIGDSADSNSVSITTHAPVTVTFVDYDGSLISKQTVDYNSSANAPTDPERRGYTFLYWDKANELQTVTKDLTVTAVYRIKTFSVKFFALDGTQIGATQKVTYQSSATAPDYSDYLPTGYALAGWKVTNASDDSVCDYKCVDSDMNLQAVTYWENEELPIVASIQSAVRDPNTGNYTVTVELTNYPTQATTAMLRVALKTADGKLVKTVKNEFEIAADETVSKTLTLKYSGTASVAEAMVLELKDDDLTGSAYSQSVTAQVTVPSGKVWTEWSEWSDMAPTASYTGEALETRTLYRTHTKSTTTSTSSTMSGWTLADTSTEWSNYGPWSSWSTTPVSQSDSVNVETTKLYRYYYYLCPYCGAHEPFCGTSDCGRQISASDFVIGWFNIPYSQSYPQSFGYTSRKYYTIALDGQVWIFSSGNLYDNAIGTTDADGGDAVIAQGYRYRTRSQRTLYNYYRWSDWSDWSETPQTQTATTGVETKNQYRYRDQVDVYSDIAGTEDATGSKQTVSGNMLTDGVDLSGKYATIMVYRGTNTDPNEDQIQYIGQTIIGAGNSYSFEFTPKSDPTEATGDYIVALGVEGTTGLINVGVIEAPKRQYKVEFYDADGTLLDSQMVAEGENAKVPDSPTKEGVDFVSWSAATTGIYADTTITACYIPKQYTVVFVDWANQTVGFQKGAYGDTIVSPGEPQADGKTFKGWDALLNGNTTITGDTIVNAVYDTASYTVKFLDEAGNAVNTQEVQYGSAATPPSTLNVTEGKVFLGWSTGSEWWNVKSDMTVEPLVAYEETALAPVANTDRTIIGTSAFVGFSADANAKIYFTTDGTAPTAASTEYTGQMYFDTTTTVKAIAVEDGKNDSAVSEVLFVYDATPKAVEDEAVVEIGTQNVMARPGDTITLTVNVENNPGLTGYMFFVKCDPSVFYADNDDGSYNCAAGTVSQNGSIMFAPYGTDGWRVLWYDVAASSGDGTLFTITLAVDENATAGVYPVTLCYSPENTLTTDNVKSSLKAADLALVTNATAIMGDTNGDGKLNLSDVILLARHNIGLSTITANNLLLADVNGDGKVNNVDVIRLARFMVGLEKVL